MPWDPRQHFPFRFSIRTKLILPVAILTLLLSVAGFEALFLMMKAKLDTQRDADLRHSGALVRTLLQARLQRLDLICRLAAGGLGGDARARGTPGSDRAALLEEEGLHFLSAAGWRSGSDDLLLLHGQRRGASVGLHRFNGGPELQMFARCGEGEESLMVEQGLGPPFIHTLKEVIGLEVAFQMEGSPFGASTLGAEWADVVFRNLREAHRDRDEVVGEVTTPAGTFAFHLFNLRPGSRPSVHCLLLREQVTLHHWLKRLRRDTLLTSVGLLFFFLAAYVWLIHRITRPIHRLRDAMGRVAKGDYRAIPEVPSRDELGDLSGAFQAMASTLAAKEKELQVATHTILHQERLASVGQMVAGIMHEIKNPLNSLSIMVRLLGQGADRGEAEAILGRMDADLKRVTESVNQLLSLSRKPKQEEERVDLCARIRHLTGTMRSYLFARNVDLVLDLADTELPVSGQAGRIDQVIYNLVFNALQAMEEGGTLTLSARILPPGEGPGRDLVLLEVRDTGKGIRQEDLPRVFDPFFTTKAAGEGTGLGLAIVKGIVEDHRGTIVIQSAPGEGTLVSIRFPKASPGEGAGPGGSPGRGANGLPM